MSVGHVGRIVSVGVLLIIASQAYAAPFTPGNLAIFRYGDGTESLASTQNAVSAYIDEYTTGGGFIQSIPLPKTGSNALTVVGNASRDGIIQLSQDGHAIALGGYRADQGTVNVVSGVSAAPRVIGVVHANGSVDTSTTFTNVLTGQVIRSVASLDGTSFYASADGSNAAAYIPYGPSSTGIAVQSGTYRSVHVENSQLYGTSGSTGNRGVLTIGSGLPNTSGQSFTTLTSENLPVPPGGGPGVSSIDFANDTSNVIYAAGSSLTNPSTLSGEDDFRRYIKSGSNYVGASNTTVLFPGAGVSTYGVYAVPNGLGGETVFMTTRTSLYKVVDANPLSTNFASLSLVKLADAPVGTEFRGLTGTPVPEPSTIVIAVLGIVGGFAARAVLTSAGTAGEILRTNNRRTDEGSWRTNEGTYCGNCYLNCELDDLPSFGQFRSSEVTIEPNCTCLVSASDEPFQLGTAFGRFRLEVFEQVLQFAIDPALSSMRFIAGFAHC